MDEDMIVRGMAERTRETHRAARVAARWVRLGAQRARKGNRRARSVAAAAARSRAVQPRVTTARPRLLVGTRAPEHTVLVVSRRAEHEIPIHIQEPEL